MSRAKQRGSIMGDSDKEGEYEVDDLREGFKSSRGSRFNLIANQFGFRFGFRRNFSSQSLITGIRHFSKGSVIHPDNRSVYPLSFSLSLCGNSNFCLDYIMCLRDYWENLGLTRGMII